MSSLEAAVALSEAEQDRFYLKAFMIQGWLSQLVAQAAAEYAPRLNRRYRVMQTGQAQRGFLQTFGNVADAQFHDLLDSLYRFTEYDHPLAGILFRALLSLSIEQECSGDFLEPRAPDLSKRPCEASALLRQSLERWCDWIDAVVHLRTHAHSHLAPERFDSPGPERRESAASDLKLPPSARTHAPDIPSQQGLNSETGASWSDTAHWQVFSQAMLLQAKELWPFQEADEAVISLWPLLKRHHWTYGGLLNVLQDLLRRPEVQPCRSEQVFATYCASTLGLHKLGRGETAKDNRPAGYDVALRLCPPLRPPSAAGEPPWFDRAAERRPQIECRDEPRDQSEGLNFEV